MKANKYGSTAPAIAWEHAARIRKYKFEQQRQGSKTATYGTLIFAGVLVLAIAGNILYGIFA